MSFTIIWLISIIVAAYLANEKKQSVLMYLILAFATGPLAVIILLLISPQKNEGQSKVNVPAGIYTIEDMLKELIRLRTTVDNTQARINNLEQSLKKFSAPVSENLRTGGPEAGPLPPAACEDGRVPQGQDPSQDLSDKVDLTTKTFDLEMAFGKNWLSKIGIVVFTLGMVFLISYTFKYFGPAVKILFGYFVSMLFFYCGKQLEKNEKFVSFGRVVWGGGWALAYFTTYAMHHFAASRIMDNAYLNLALLAILVVGLLAYVVKYKNEDMMSIALFASYIAATMGQVTNFTLLSCLLLAGIVLFLVYRFQWIKTLALSIILTYGIHQIWVVPNIASTGGQILWWTVTSAQFAQSLNLTFLTLYALVFLAATHIARTDDEEDHKNTIAAVNVGNITGFSLLGYPLIAHLFLAQRFVIVFLVGLVLLALALMMKYNQREKIYQSDLIAALFMLTFTVSLKFTDLSSLMIWIIEVPFLLLIAQQFKEKIYAYASYALTCYLGLWFVNRWGYGDMAFFSYVIKEIDFIHLCEGIAMAVSFYILRRDKASHNEVDKIFEHLFPIAACVNFIVLIFSVVKGPWISLSLSIAAAILLIFSLMLGLKCFRLYAYLVLMIAQGVFIGTGYHGLPVFTKWFIILGNLFAFGSFYIAVKTMKKVKSLSILFDHEEVVLFMAALSMLVFTVFAHSSYHLISLNLGLAGVALIVAGIGAKDKTERLGGLFLLGITLCRIVFVDLSGLDVIFKIITFIVLGLLFLGASYVYNRFGSEK